MKLIFHISYFLHFVLQVSDHTRKECHIENVYNKKYNTGVMFLTLLATR